MMSWATTSLVWNPSVEAARANPLRGFLLALALAIGVQAPCAHAIYSRSELDSVQTPTEVQVRELRDQEINQLRITLGRRIPVNRKAELYFRLSELYLEAYRAEFILEGKVFEKRFAAGRKDPRMDRDSSRAILSKGIKACEELIALKIPFEKIDRIHYFLAVYYAEMGDEARSLAEYEGLIVRYPQSPLIVEAHRELGEVAFRKGDFAGAEKQFSLALTKDQGEGSARILHKLAWTYYRTRKYDLAVSTMKQAASRANQSGEKLLSLREEALRDMAIFLSETQRADEAVEYFQKMAGDQAYFAKLLERLGAQFERGAQPERAIQVYEMLLATQPKAEASFRVLVKLVELDLRRGRTKGALARLQGRPLYKGGEPETEVAATNLRAMIRRTATESHEVFRKTGSIEALTSAESYYATYLDRFVAEQDPRNEKPEIQMYLADVKRELGKTKEASVLYRSVVDSGDPRYAKEAGALWTASLADSIQKDSVARPVSAVRGVPAQGQPSAVEKEFITAADQMQKNLGDQAEGREAALKAAQVVAGYQATQSDAIKRSKRIIERSPGSPQALIAARLWMQIEVDNKSDDLPDLMAKLKGNSALMATDQAQGEGKVREMIEAQERKIKIGVIADSENSKDFSAAAKGYEEFAESSKEADVAERAYANAVSSYAKSGDVKSSSRVLGLWSARFPKSASSSESAKFTATLALIQGSFDTAATLFERLGKDGKNSEATLTAARIFQGSGNSERGRQVWKEFLKIYSTSAERFNVELKLAQSLLGESLSSEAKQHLKSCAEGGGVVLQGECSSRLADLMISEGNFSEAKKIFSKLAALKNTSETPYISYARFRLAALLEKEKIFATPLQLPERQLQKALSERLEFFQVLNKAYLSAVDAGGPWAVAALDRLARWAIEFANDVDEIQPSSSGGGAGFQRSIEAISGPLRKKAVEIWLNAYQTAVRAEILSPALPAIGDQIADAGLTQQNLNAPPRAQGYRGRFRIWGVPSDGGSEGRAQALRKTRDRLSQNPKDGPAWVDYGNLLWGEGKPLLSMLAYDRSLELNSRDAAALNNRAVVLLSGSGEEDWSRAAEGRQLFKLAIKSQSDFLASTFNLAILFNYYRLFSVSKPYWDQVVSRLPSADAWDGQAIALQGTGAQTLADALFSKAQGQGAKSNRFASRFHLASQVSTQGVTGAKKCYTYLMDLDGPELGGFEKSSVDYLRKACKLWKSD